MSTRYVKVTATFVLGYEEPLDVVPSELGNVQKFLLAGVEAAFIDKSRTNRGSVYICPYATLSGTLIHAPRSGPRVMTQTGEGVQTFLTRKQEIARAKRQEAASEASADAASLRKTRKVPKTKGVRRVDG